MGTPPDSRLDPRLRSSFEDGRIQERDRERWRFDALGVGRRSSCHRERPGWGGAQWARQEPTNPTPVAGRSPARTTTDDRLAAAGEGPRRRWRRGL